VRGSGPITVVRLFVGVLLGHADSQGEVRQLLDHFELTARDVLPDDFPPVTVESLRAAAATVTARETPTMDRAVDEILSTAGSLAGGRAQLAHVLGALLQRSTPLRQALQPGLDRFGYDVRQLAEAYVAHLPELDLSGPVPAGTQIGPTSSSTPGSTSRPTCGPPFSTASSPRSRPKRWRSFRRGAAPRSRRSWRRRNAR
jgi:hypothetical protein